MGSAIKNRIARHFSLRYANRLHIYVPEIFDYKNVLFISNHTDKSEDTTSIVSSFYRMKKEIPHFVVTDDLFRPDYKEGGKRTNNRYPPWFYKPLHFAFYWTAERADTIIPITRKNSPYARDGKRKWWEYYKEPNNIQSYINALKEGKNVLIYGTGTITRDGKIDYTRDEVPNRVKKSFNFVHKLAPETSIVFVHNNCDIVTGQHFVKFGKPITKENSTGKILYTEQMKPITTITGIQLLDTIENAGINEELSAAIDEARRAGLDIVPHISSHEIQRHTEQFVQGGNRLNLKKKIGPNIVVYGSPEYQRNTVAHLENDIISAVQL